MCRRERFFSFLSSGPGFISVSCVCVILLLPAYSQPAGGKFNDCFALYPCLPLHRPSVSQTEFPLVSRAVSWNKNRKYYELITPEKWKVDCDFHFIHHTESFTLLPYVIQGVEIHIWLQHADYSDVAFVTNLTWRCKFLPFMLLNKKSHLLSSILVTHTCELYYYYYYYWCQRNILDSLSE